MLTALIVGAIAAILAVAAARKGADFFADAIAQWRRLLARELDDPATLAAAQVQLDAIEQDAATLAAHSLARVAELGAVHGCYGSTLADYDAIIDAMVVELFVDQAAIVDGVQELREVIGDDAYLRIMSEIEGDLRKARAKRERKRG